MAKNILIINGHPDAGHHHLGDALANAYAEGARQAGHEVSMLTIAQLDFPLLSSRDDWEKAEPPADIKLAQQQITAASHLVFVYPLWLGSMPALLKGFLEQVLRPGFAFSYASGGRTQKKLRGKSARVVITMGMPGPVYRWFFGAHSLKSFERNILAFCGIGPVRSTLVGMVESHKPQHQEQALNKLRKLGELAR